jgi:hypothetical protein
MKGVLDVEAELLLWMFTATIVRRRFGCSE